MKFIKYVLWGFIAFMWGVVIGTAVGRAFTAHTQPLVDTTTDTYIRNRTVLLSSPVGSCTGVQILSPKGTVYTLTAGHCVALLQGGKVLATNEDATTDVLDLVAEDPKSDLMLLTSPKNSGINVASETWTHEAVHTITRGHAMPSYRTDGELLRVSMVAVPYFAVVTPEDAARCAKYPKYKLFTEEGLFTTESICAIATYEMMTTAKIIPGSSGGPILNRAGQLVGIASCTDEYFSGIVTIVDIRSFLSQY